MRDFRDAKAMARRLREALAEKNVTLTHTASLELIARSFGLKDWQVLAAMIGAAEAPASTPDPGDWSGPALYLRDVVAFPKLTFPLFVGRAMSKEALARAYSGEQEVLLVTQKRREDDDPTTDGLYGMGVVADVLSRTLLADDTMKLLVRGRQRARLLGLTRADGFPRAQARLVAPDLGKPSDADPLVERALAAASDFLISRTLAGERAQSTTPDWFTEITSRGVLADLIAGIAVAPVPAKQALLETLDARRRLERAVELITPAAPQAA